MQEEELLPRDLHIVEHADEPDMTAGPCGADGLHHRFLRANLLDDANVLVTHRHRLRHRIDAPLGPQVRAAHPGG